MARVKLLQDVASARGLYQAGSLMTCSEADAGRMVAAGIAVMVGDPVEAAMAAPPETAARPRRAPARVERRT